MTLKAAEWHYRNPLKSIAGKPCRRCGKPATHAILTIMVYPACKDCAEQAEKLGYDVVAPAPAAAEDGAK